MTDARTERITTTARMPSAIFELVRMLPRPLRLGFLADSASSSSAPSFLLVSMATRS